MQLKIQHNSVYRYEASVELNPHKIFLIPLQRSYVHLKKYDISISPKPEGINERYSIEGNPYFLVWFYQKADKLEIMVNLELENTPFNPFSFVMDTTFLKNVDLERECPFSYDWADTELLQPYLKTSQISSLMDYARQALTNSDPLSFLTSLTTEIYKNWKHIIREEQNLWTPSDSFSKGTGSCRDLSWMMIHMLRSMGLAARFVSGYAYNPKLEEGHELHAWLEVYLPGGGWIGLDPNLGLLTDENYIPLAISHHPSNTLPVHGTYGGKTQAELKTFVLIENNKFG